MGMFHFFLINIFLSQSHFTKSVINLLLEMSDHFVSENSNIYDIGCSTENLQKNSFKRHNSLKIQSLWFRPSKEMIKFAMKK